MVGFLDGLGIFQGDPNAPTGFLQDRNTLALAGLGILAEGLSPPTVQPVNPLGGIFRGALQGVQVGNAIKANNIKNRLAEAQLAQVQDQQAARSRLFGGFDPNSGVTFNSGRVGQTPDRQLADLVTAGGDGALNAMISARINPPEQFEAVTDAAGNVVGQRNTRSGRVVNDPRATTRRPQSTVGKLALDLQNGVIDEATFAARIDKLTRGEAGKAQSQLGKLAQDRQRGLIDDATFDAARSKLLNVTPSVNEVLVPIARKMANGEPLTAAEQETFERLRPRDPVKALLQGLLIGSEGSSGGLAEQRALQEARDALANGVSRSKVVQRLEQLGLDPRKL